MVNKYFISILKKNDSNRYDKNKIVFKEQENIKNKNNILSFLWPSSCINIKCASFSSNFSKNPLDTVIIFNNTL